MRVLMMVLFCFLTLPGFAQMVGARTGYDAKRDLPRAERVDEDDEDDLGPLADVEDEGEGEEDEGEDEEGEEGEELDCEELPSGFLPIGRDNDSAKCFWNQGGQQWLKNAQFVSSEDAAAVANEMLSDFAYGIRFGFSTAITTGDADTESEEEDAAARTLNLLRANGGNVAFNASYPIYAREYDAGDFLAISYGRLAGNFSAFGEPEATSSSTLDWKDLNGNTEVSLLTRASLFTVNDTFRFYLFSNTGVIAGTKLFREALGADTSAFLHGEFGASLRISETLTVGASYNWYSADGLPTGATFTLGVGR
jgi:hypothetical protein